MNWCWRKQTRHFRCLSICRIWMTERWGQCGRYPRPLSLIQDCSNHVFRFHSSSTTDIVLSFNLRVFRHCSLYLELGLPTLSLKVCLQVFPSERPDAFHHVMRYFYRLIAAAVFLHLVGQFVIYHVCERAEEGTDLSCGSSCPARRQKKSSVQRHLTLAPYLKDRMRLPSLKSYK